VARTYGSYMLQPTKNDLRQMIRDLRKERDHERLHRETLERRLRNTSERLDEAARLIGHQVIEASLNGELPAPGPLRLIAHQD
jgi:hypothetical protein